MNAGKSKNEPKSLEEFIVDAIPGQEPKHRLEVRMYQGNLKGESVVVAILPSHMEVSYCTSGFFL